MKSLWLLLNKRSVAPYIFLLPLFIYILVVWFYPVVMNLYMSFFDWDFIRESQFVGLDNYEKMFADPNFFKGLRNSVVYTLFLPLTLIPAFLVAVVLQEVNFARGFFRSAYYLTSIISLYGLALIFRFLFADQVGLVNNTLVGLGFERVSWLSDSTSLIVIIGVLTVFKGVGWNMLVYVGGLQALDTTLYESARIDGANWWQVVTRITVPLMRPVITFTAIMAFVYLFQLFSPIILIASRGRFTNVPTGVRTPVVEAYIQSFGLNNPGYGSAIMLVMSVLALCAAAFILWRSARAD